MYCDQCGVELNAGQRFCNRCGKEIVGVFSFAPPRPGRVHAHIRMLGILWLALSALDVVGGMVMVLLSRTLFVELTAQGVPGFVGPLVHALGIFSLAKGAGGFIAGWGLLNRQPWARMLALVLGVVALFFHIPFGTALGIYTLWVLLPAHSEEEYERYQRPAA